MSIRGQHVREPDAAEGAVPATGPGSDHARVGAGAYTRGWWPTRSVRVRILASVLLMALLGVTVAGTLVYVVQHRSITATVTASLEQEVQEFRTLAQTGLDPETGQPFTSIERLLRVALQRNVPDRNETYLAFRDGVPLAYNAGERPIQLEAEPAVLAAVADMAPGSGVAITDVPTSAGLARIAIVPVAMAGQSVTGSLVLAFAIDREREELQRLARIYALVSLATLVVVAAVGWQVAGRLLRPLQTLSEATQRITETDLSQRIPVIGHDNVSELTRTYNAMLDRLEEAFDTQRRFLDDAGHELRTPLTIVRGHLELVDVNDPADVAETRALLLDEIDRMGRMVQDLILLSKAQRPDFVVPRPIDLAVLTDDVFERARMLGDRRWIVRAHGEGMLKGDPERLTQAMIELAHNAVKSSPVGSTIEIGSALADDEARLWVRDEGRGVDPADRDRIFGRFSRGDSARAEDGSGLGLAIVASIAAAHGGQVTVSSQLGSGSTFTLVLPAGSDRDGDPAKDGSDPEPAGLDLLLGDPPVRSPLR